MALYPRHAGDRSDGQGELGSVVITHFTCALALFI